MKRFTSLLLGLALCGVAWAGPSADDVRDPLIEIRASSGPMLGVELVPLTPELRVHFGAGESGMLVGAVIADSPAAKAGIAVGDVLVAVGDEPIDRVWDARSAVTDAAGEEVEVRIVRDGRARTLTAQIPESEVRPNGRALFVHPDGNVFRYDLDDFDDLDELYEELDKHDWSIDVDELHGVLSDDIDTQLDGLSIQIDDMDARILQSLEQLEQRMHELEQQMEEQRRKGDFWNGAQ